MSPSISGREPIQKRFPLSNFPRINYAHGVVFQSEDGDSTEVILTQTANNTVLIDLDDAHRITFKKLTLLNTKSHAVQIEMVLLDQY